MTAERPVKVTEVVEAIGRVGVLSTQDCFANRQRLPIEALGMVAGLGRVQGAEIVDGHRRVGVIHPEGVLVDGDDA